MSTCNPSAGESRDRRFMELSTCQFFQTVQALGSGRDTASRNKASSD